MPSITIEQKNAFYYWEHSYLVYDANDVSDSADEVFRGGATFALDTIDVYEGLLSSSADARSNPSAHGSTLVSSSGAANQWAIISQLQDQITNANIPYHTPVVNPGDVTNSNSVTATALYTIGKNIMDYIPGNTTFERLAGAENILNFERNLEGTSGSDTIQGWHQNDTLSGGAGGSDILRGDTGADFYVIQTDAHSITIDDVDGSASIIFDTLSIGRDDLAGSIDGSEYYANGDNNIGYDVGVKFNSSTHEIEFYDMHNSNAILGKIINVDSVATGYVWHSWDPISGQGGLSINYTRLSTISGSDDLFGGSGADTLTLSGSSGSKSIYGGAGNDSLYGDSGNNHLDGGAGNDLMAGGAGNDTYFVDSSSDSVTESSSSGTDTVYSYIDYGLGSNVEGLVLIANGITGTGNSLANVMAAGGYNDTLVGGAGADTLSGGGLFTAASYSGASAAISINLTTNVNTGSDAAGDVLTNIQEIIGSAYNDTLVGSDADETFIGGAGSDSINGGNGIDTVSYVTSSAYVSGNLGTNSFFSGDASWDTVSNVENLIGSAYNDYLGGNSGTNVLDGGAGNDSLEGFDGSDTLSGGAGDDLLFGGNGDDLLIGGPGSDYIDGGSGNDTLTFATSASWVSADLAANNFWNSDAAWDNVMTNVENLTGSAYSDYLNGSSVANILDGGDGNDSIVGGDGNDTIYGGAGNDNLTGGNGNDLIVAGSGSDYVDGGANSDTLSFANSATWVSADIAGNSYWNGDAAWDNVTNVENLTGSAFNDYLYGSTAANVLTGGDGDDHIEGRAGGDTLVGGNGVDTFIFTTGGTGTDHISDFQGAGATGGDIIQLSSGVYSTATIALTHVTYSGGDATLDLGSGHSVHLVGVTSLVAGDFVIV